MNSPTGVEELARIRTLATSGPRDKPIGAILLDAGLITLEDVEPILATARDKGLRFGEAAVSLGIVKEGDLRGTLAFQFDYPVLPVGASLVSREVIAAYEASHPVLDDLRALRNQILLRWLSAEGKRNRVVAVMSAARGEGRTFVASNLAVAFSQMGQRTLLIDADLRRGRVHKLFGLDNQQGLSALLAERHTPNTLHRIVGLRNLSVVSMGADAPNPHDLLSREIFAELLHGFAHSYDVVMVDTPAALESPEAQVIAARAQGVLMVARKGFTELNSLKALAHDVRASGATIVGTALSEA